MLQNYFKQNENQLMLLNKVHALEMKLKEEQLKNARAESLNMMALMNTMPIPMASSAFGATMPMGMPSLAFMPSPTLPSPLGY